MDNTSSKVVFDQVLYNLSGYILDPPRRHHSRKLNLRAGIMDKVALYGKTYSTKV